MKKQEILNSLKKWTLTAVAFWVTIFWMVYAANIISVTTQTISTGDSIGAGWYQAVNDKLLNTYSKSDVYTKTEVNGKWYLTSHQDISNLATKTELGTKADSTSVYTKSETDSKYVKFWTTCTTSTVWIMKYDTVSKSMHICLDWKWIYFVSSIRLWEAESKPGLSCLDILNNWWNIWSGTYRIKPAWASSAFQAYCDMTTDGGWYTFYKVTWGIDTYRSTDNNTCKSLWMDIWVPRNQNHWVAANAYWIPWSPHTIVWVTKPTNWCWGCTSYPMNSSVSQQSEWKGVDWGTWWLRSTNYSEPNWDYTANCWLSFYNLDPTNIQFNDWRCSYHSTSYLCSTNDK